jgi:hypothetical protein
MVDRQVTSIIPLERNKMRFLMSEIRTYGDLRKSISNRSWKMGAHQSLNRAYGRQNSTSQRRAMRLDCCLFIVHQNKMTDPSSMTPKQLRDHFEKVIHSFD